MPLASGEALPEAMPLRETEGEPDGHPLTLHVGLLIELPEGELLRDDDTDAVRDEEVQGVGEGGALSVAATTEAEAPCVSDTCADWVRDTETVAELLLLGDGLAVTQPEGVPVGSKGVPVALPPVPLADEVTVQVADCIVDGLGVEQGVADTVGALLALAHTEELLVSEGRPVPLCSLLSVAEAEGGGVEVPHSVGDAEDVVQDDNDVLTEDEAVPQADREGAAGEVDPEYVALREGGVGVGVAAELAVGTGSLREGVEDTEEQPEAEAEGDDVEEGVVLIDAALLPLPAMLPLPHAVGEGVVEVHSEGSAVALLVVLPLEQPVGDNEADALELTETLLLPENVGTEDAVASGVTEEALLFDALEVPQALTVLLPLLLLHAVELKEKSVERDAEGQVEALREPLLQGVAEGLPLNVRQLEDVAGAVTLPLPVVLISALPVTEAEVAAVRVCSGENEDDAETQGVGVALGDMEATLLALGEAVEERDGEGLRLPVGEALCELLALGNGDVLGVPQLLADEEEERVEDVVPQLLREGRDERVGEEVPQLLGEAGGERVGEALVECEPLLEAHAEYEGVQDNCAVVLKRAVIVVDCEGDGVEDAENDWLADALGQADPVRVSRAEEENCGEPLTEALILAERVVAGEIVLLALRSSEKVCSEDAEAQGEVLGLPEGLLEPAALKEGGGEAVNEEALV